MKTVLIPLPSQDFDPTECAIPWKILSNAGVRVVVATPDGNSPRCDQRMLTGEGLGLFARILKADARARETYSQFSSSAEFLAPISWNDISVENFDGLILPGGHAPKMKEYLESAVLQSRVAEFFNAPKPVGAICHGVVLASRSVSPGQSVLAGRKTTALLESQEMLAWWLTRHRVGNYYRTYSESVEAEVRRAIGSRGEFLRGPLPLLRDAPAKEGYGFTVTDGLYVSARWPGDAHAFAQEFLRILLR